MPMIELYKVKNELAPPIMDTMLNRRNVTYNFRNLQVSVRKKVNCFLWSGNFKLPSTQLWTRLSEEIKQRNTISLFKSDVKQGICKECPGRLSKVFVQNLSSRQIHIQS